MAVKEEILVFGASGHAKVVIDIIEKQGLFEISCIVDDNLTLKGGAFEGYSIIGDKDDLMALAARPRNVVVAIGSNGARREVAAWLEDQGFALMAVIHPSAQLGREVFVGPGSVVMANAVINSAARIGKNSIINTGASIDHDCILGENVHVAPGATLCGTVTVGNDSFVGAGATVIPNLILGEKVTVGAGAVVIRNIPDGVTVVGNPAKFKS